MALVWRAASAAFEAVGMFGRLLTVARGFGADVVATGHYARTARGDDGRMRLLRSRDARKDQTYMLFQLDQEQLASARFPLGDTEKGDVREEARALGFDVADKPDSQELCFISDAGHRAFLKERAPETVVPGVFVNEAGEEIGTHDGAAGYTIGQRKGLPAVGVPQYVREVDAASGRITVAGRDALLRDRVVATAVNWIEVESPEVGATFDVLVRHRHRAGHRRRLYRAVGCGDA